MQTLGIIGYIILCLLAIISLLYVRTQWSCTIPLVLASLFFVTSAITLPLSGISFLHAWWMIPAGYVVIFLSMLLFTLPVLGPLLRIVGSIYAGVVRIGIDHSQIRNAQIEANRVAVEDWAKRQDA